MQPMQLAVAVAAVVVRAELVLREPATGTAWGVLKHVLPALRALDPGGGGVVCSCIFPSIFNLYIYTHTQARTRTHRHEHAHRHAHRHTCTRTHTGTHTRVYISIYLSIYLPIYLPTYLSII